MNRIFNKKDILTIPNLLSLVRLLMLPVIVWLYVKEKNYYAATAMVFASGITDIADGIIARKFQLVSDLGKILDPVADKLTQAALIICLIEKFEWMLWLFVLFAIKEIVMGISGMVVIKKKDVVNSSQWFGKLATVVLYAVMFTLFLFPNASVEMANAMILICAAVLLLAFIKYLRFHISLLRSKES